MSEKITIAVWDSLGNQKSGASVELVSGSTSYSSVELGSSGRYYWSSIPLGKYFLYVDSVNTGESFAVGEGELAGLGYSDGKYLASRVSNIEWAYPYVREPVTSFGFLPDPIIGTQCFVTGEDCYYQVGSDGTWRKRGITEIADLGNQLSSKLSRAGGTMTGDIDFELPGDTGSTWALNFLSEDGNTEMHISAEGMDGKKGAGADWWYYEPERIGLVSALNEPLNLNAGIGLQVYSDTGFIDLSGTTKNKSLYMANDVDGYYATISTGGDSFTPYVNLYDSVHSANLDTTDLQFSGVSIFTSLQAHSTVLDNFVALESFNGALIRMDGSGGFYTDEIDYLAMDNVTKQGSGFSTPEMATVSYDSATRKITIGGTTQGYWRHKSVAGLTSGWISDARPDTSGVWLLKYNGSSYSWSNTAWAYDEIQIAFGIKTSTAEIWLRECHGLTDWMQHQDEHQARGTYKSAGGDFSGYVLGSNTATNRRPQISSTTLWDEDLSNVLPALSTNSYAWFWLTGSGVANITTANAEIIPLSGSNPVYNSLSGTWGQTNFANNDYGKIFVVAVPVTGDTTNQAKRYLFIQPQTASSSLTTIQAVTSDTVNWGDFAGILPEFNFIGEIIVRYKSGDWKLTSVAKINGTRAGQSVSGSGFLSSVTVDGITITGDGTPASPLAVGTLDWAKITTGKPTTLSGYGITDAIDTGTTPQIKSSSLTIDGTQASIYNTTEAVNTPTGVQGNVVSNSSPTTGTASYHKLTAKNSTSQTAMGYWGIVSGANAYTQSVMFWGFRTASGAYTEVARLTTSGGLSLPGDLSTTGALTATASATLKHAGTTRIETTTTGAKVTGTAEATNASKTVQASTTTTGAITWDLSSGAILSLNSALTGSVTLNISNQVAGSKCELFYIQGASRQVITLSATGVVFRQTRSAVTGTGTMALTLDVNINYYYRLTLEWITTTLCNVVIA